MRFRTTLILLVLNAAVAALLWITAEEAVVERRKTLVPDNVDLGPSVERIEFSAAPQAPAFSLVRDERRRWRLDRADGPLASQPVANAVLEALQRAPILPFDVGQGADLGLDPPQRSLTLKVTGGAPVRVAIGRSVARGTFARFGDESSAHLTSNGITALLEHQPGTLRELRPFAFSALDVNRMTFRRRRPGGVDEFDAERRWLTWFVLRPQGIRGNTRILDGIVAALIGLTRTSAVVPIADLRGAPPAIELSIATKDDTVSADVWALDQARGSWIVRIGDEDTGFRLESGALRSLLVQIPDLYDRRLFHDPASVVSQVEWRRGTSPVTALERGVDRLWRLTAPREARADGELAKRFVEDLVQFEAIGVEGPGADPAAFGFTKPSGFVRITLGSGVAETLEFAGAPQVTHVRMQSRPGNLYRVASEALDALLPTTPLGMLDREVLATDWRRIHGIDIVQGGKTYQFEKAGTTAAEQWKRTPYEDDRRGEPTTVRGQPMRLFLSVLAKLRADGIVAWGRASAPPALGLDAPDYVIRFRDPRTGQSIEFCIGAAQPAPNGIGDDWHPVWFAGGALPGRSFVYRIGPELARRTADTLR